MLTPEMSGIFEVQVDLKGGHRLPVSIIVPDIPESPPPEEHIVPNPSPIAADKRADSVSDADTSSVHGDATVHTEVDRINLLSVSASPT